ncbi:kinectin isoform X3 [Pleurodeles waltl]|uniref:kinectin isoform X3 n=1 Tax=Pleurodeles waltl TaxID=8319 RepID=UPI003709A185
MEFYESTYFIVLVPSVVITVIFLFFWLFMKETSYDEVLAKQKKDLKIPPAKIDKKRTDKRKSKRKEAHNGNLHESDSESAMPEFDLMDALSIEEEHSVPVTLSTAEHPSSIRERKKKEKKQARPVQEQTAVGGSKYTGKKVESIPVTKQPTPPLEATGTKKKPGQKKQTQSRDDSPPAQDLKVEPFVPVTKKHDSLVFTMDTKQQETGAGKKKNAVKKQKIENGLVDEPLIQATTYIPLMDKTEVNPTMEKKEVIKLERVDISETIHKSSGKKLKNETEITNGKHGGSKKKYENAEVKFKDFLLSMKSMVFTDDESLSILDLLKDKSSTVHDTLQKASKCDSGAAAQLLQEKEKCIVVAKEEAAVAKEQVKQLTQELLEEKQKSGMVEHKIRDRFSTLEKEHSALQSRMHVSCQETQQLQLKFQQVRDQLEDQIAHLKQENGILRDAVSSATNQMESKQSSELNKLRQDYARLMNELTEKNNKLAQEEVQKKNAEQTTAQLKAQVHDAELRWKEVETYLRKRTAEFEAAQQDIQSTLIAKENEVQSLHSKLTDTMVSKQQLEQKLMQLMESEKNRVTENAIQIQVEELMEQNDALQTQIQKFHAQMSAQTSASVLVEELQKAIAEKDKQIKKTEESLAFEHVHLTNREEELKVLQRENASLKSEFQQIQVLKNEQVAAAHAFEQMQRSMHEKDENIRALEERLQNELIHFSNKMEDYKGNRDLVEQMERSIQEKDEKLKTVEELLEAGLIQVANKEDELKAMRREYSTMQREIENLHAQQADQASLKVLIEELKEVIHEKDGRIKMTEERLQAEVLKTANKEETVQALMHEIEDLKKRNIHLENIEQASAIAQVQENQIKIHEEKIQTVEAMLGERDKDISLKEKRIQGLRIENENLKIHISEIQQQYQQLLHQESHAVQSEELLDIITKKEQDISSLQNELDSLKNLLEQQRTKNNDLRMKNWQAMEALASTEKRLQEKVNSTAKVRDQQMQVIETETKETLEKLFPHVSVPSNLKHGDWLLEFGKLVKACVNEPPASENVQVMEQRLKDAEEVHVLLQLECEKYKSVLAETEGILQRLQSSVEEEEGRWKIKLEETQKELLDVSSLVNSLKQEIASLKTENKNIENLKKEREHLESELEKAELERVTYVGEVRELKDLLTELQKKLDDSNLEAVKQSEELNLLKTKLTETLLKLDNEQSKRLKVADNLFQAQQSLDVIQSEILKAAGDTSVIENSDVSSEVETDRKGLMAASLNQTVVQLQQLFQALNQQLTKGNEHFQIIE